MTPATKARINSLKARERSQPGPWEYVSRNDFDWLIIELEKYDRALEEADSILKHYSINDRDYPDVASECRYTLKRIAKILEGGACD